MQNSQERALIEAAAGGDPAAFEKLMRMHEGKMYAVALRMCASREDAQDACMKEKCTPLPCACAPVGKTRRTACKKP